MRQEVNYGIPIIVLLALIAAITSDYCRPFPLSNKIASLDIPSSFNPFCYVADFSPEPPEISTHTTTSSSLNNPLSVSATGTAFNSLGTTTTLQAQASPSEEIPEA